MEDKVVVLNDKGEVLGSKVRTEVDKKNDILHTVYVFVFTPNKELLLSVIPENQVNQNLFIGKLGITVATLMREGESTNNAAKRGFQKELNTNGNPLFLSEGFFVFENNVRRKVSCFAYVSDQEISNYNPKDIETLMPVTRQKVEQMLRENERQFADTFLGVYKKYNQKLPF